MVFGFTNFTGLVDKGQSLCKISKSVGALNERILVKRPFCVHFSKQVENGFPSKTCLPLMGGRAPVLGEGDVLNPKGANRRFLWFLFRPFREVLTVASCPLVRRLEVPCHRCKQVVCGR